MPIRGINPTQYAQPLVIAAEEVTLEIGQALKKLHEQLIQHPEEIAVYRREYEKKVKRAVLKWRKSRKRWIKEDLPKAYIHGVRQGESELNSLGLNTESTDQIPSPTTLIRMPPL